MLAKPNLKIPPQLPTILLLIVILAVLIYIFVPKKCGTFVWIEGCGIGNVGSCDVTRRVDCACIGYKYWPGNVSKDVINGTVQPPSGKEARCIGIVRCYER